MHSKADLMCINERFFLLVYLYCTRNFTLKISNQMKRLLLSLMLTISVVIFVPFQSFGQDIPDDGEEIEIDINTNSSDTGPRRTTSIVPLTAFYFQSLSCIGVVFNENIGDVTITLTNLTSGSLSSIVVDSQIGYVVVPFTPISGLWQISFYVMESGPSYSGTFII